MDETPASGVAKPETEVLLRRDEGGVAYLTLNRPRQFNALSGCLLDAMHGALDAIAKDESVRVVVITGAGAAFCAGHDLKEMRALASQAEVEALFKRCSAMRTFSSTVRFGKTAEIWKERMMPRRAPSAGLSCVMSWPLNRIVPVVGAGTS